DRPAVVLRADGRWFVGPDNGVLAMVARRARTVHWWRIDWRPPHLSHSFHGRDLFAPVAAALTRGDTRGLVDIPGPVVPGAEWPEELEAVVYIDHYGNALTGMRAAAVPAGASLRAGGTLIGPAEVFGAVPPGRPLWYENSNGLAEIAVNQGRADDVLGLVSGSAVTPVVGDGTLS
ncbi:MAG: SAM hydrolase/SAM-dependent halogenase family protein, partial [Pseudomonadota bacterium]